MEFEHFYGVRVDLTLRLLFCWKYRNDATLSWCRDRLSTGLPIDLNKDYALEKSILSSVVDINIELSSHFPHDLPRIHHAWAGFQAELDRCANIGLTEYSRNGGYTSAHHRVLYDERHIVNHSNQSGRRIRWAWKWWIADVSLTANTLRSGF